MPISVSDLPVSTSGGEGQPVLRSSIYGLQPRDHQRLRLNQEDYRTPVFSHQALITSVGLLQNNRRIHQKEYISSLTTVSKKTEVGTEEIKTCMSDEIQLLTAAVVPNSKDNQTTCQQLQNLTLKICLFPFLFIQYSMSGFQENNCKTLKTKSTI